jgi:hypothetical protein
VDVGGTNETGRGGAKLELSDWRGGSGAKPDEIDGWRGTNPEEAVGKLYRELGRARDGAG